MPNPCAQDIEAPALMAPAAKTCECSTQGGSPANDPRIAGWIGDVSCLDALGSATCAAINPPAFFRSACGDGDGDTIDDCIVAADGQSFMVRAERADPDAAGRRYAARSTHATGIELGDELRSRAMKGSTNAKLPGDEPFPPDPLDLLLSWHAEAAARDDIAYAAAASLATVDIEGRPDARMVIVERIDGEGLVFLTDVDSPKGRALDRLPEAAILFYWGPLERQVKVRGSVELAPDALADELFARRPRPSRITAWASRQSRPLDDRAELEASVARADERFAGVEDVPRPPHWRAYRLRPREVEFWRAGARRLHDRLLYRRRPDSTWEHGRLYP